MSKYDYPLGSFEHRAYEQLERAGFAGVLNDNTIKLLIETIVPAHQEDLEDLHSKIDDRVHVELVKALKPVKDLLNETITDLTNLEGKL